MQEICKTKMVDIKMKKRIILSLIVVVLFSWSATLLAQPYRGYLIDKLDLSDKQLNDIEKLRDDHLKKMTDLRSELEKLGIDLRSEWRKSSPDRKKIEALTDKMSEVRAKMQKQKLNHWFDVYNLLDEKQKEKFREFRSEFFKDGKFLGPKFRKEFFRQKPRIGRGFGPCGCGLGPWWDQ